MVELYAAFVEGIAEPTRSEFPEAATRSTLAEHADAARAAWPDLAIDDDQLGRELARRLGDAGHAGLAACRIADLYLAIACCNGNTDAIERVRDIVNREVDFAGGKTGARPDQVADVKAEIGRVMFVDEPGRPAALREYAGRGDLKSYVRVIATRDLIRAVQRGRRDVPHDEDALVALLSHSDDLELGVLRERYRDSVATSLRVAVDRLDQRQRALLRYQLVDGMNVDRVGALYGVHRATAARWIAAAREALGTLIREEVARALAIPTVEVDSIVRLVQSRIDVSLARIIKD
jgi:RNA polymerase sigma-70 factor (ECF subfamily)